jgi:parallel beta-helix repeat protein
MRHTLHPFSDPHPTQTEAVSAAVLVALALACWLAIGAAHASAAQVKCGDTITTDTTLHHNLVNCPNNGIVIGADNITFDLNGHTIDGDGRLTHGCPETEFCDVGVANFGHNGVTVVHGSLRQFGGGVDFGDVRHNRLLDISASRNHSVGIQVFSCSRSLIRDSSGTDSTSPDDGTGLGVFGCDHVRVINNSVRRNVGHHGMVLVDSNHSLIKGNRVSRNGGEGVILELALPSVPAAIT